jgi:hypothetical protein
LSEITRLTLESRTAKLAEAVIRNNAILHGIAQMPRRKLTRRERLEAQFYRLRIALAEKIAGRSFDEDD